MNAKEKFVLTLEDMKRVADSLDGLGAELEASAKIRAVAFPVSSDDERGSYRLPYASRPEFIGETWV